jgi:hypothetical protein
MSGSTSRVDVLPLFDIECVGWAVREMWPDFCLPTAMATKAERYRAEAQRGASLPKAITPKAHAANRTVDASTAGVSGAGTARHNFTKRAANHGGSALELSGASKPSRKSTRSSAGRAKQGSNLSRRQTRRVTSSKARATRAAARA